MINNNDNYRKEDSLESEHTRTTNNDSSSEHPEIIYDSESDYNSSDHNSEEFFVIDENCLYGCLVMLLAFIMFCILIYAVAGIGEIIFSFLVNTLKGLYYALKTLLLP